jgi:PPK2 family polyphosphate:nucleotide phosphotransferase
MNLKLDIEPFRVPDGSPFKLAKAKTKVKDVYDDDKHYDALIREYQEEIDELQQQMYAQDRHGLLLVFQAMDAAGKDSTIKHVMSGINPQGVEVHAFKRPSEEELDHDYLWRTTQKLPPRGHIGIFNRSYYEEVLVCKVHPEIVTKYQRLPESATTNLKKLFDQRLEDIQSFEAYCDRNGIHIVKFFLNVSKEEQKDRFIARIDTPAKNWKFNDGDVKERAFWNDYMDAYEDAIKATATDECPWYVVPADDKKNMRLIVSAAILAELKKLKLAWPELPADQKATLAACREELMNEPK